MAQFRGLGLKRPVPLTFRLSEEERAELERRAREAEISMVEYARCRIFGVPLSKAKGRRIAPPRRKATTDSQAT